MAKQFDRDGLRLLIRLARFRKSCRKLPPIEVPESLKTQILLAKCLLTIKETEHENIDVDSSYSSHR